MIGARRGSTILVTMYRSLTMLLTTSPPSHVTQLPPQSSTVHAGSSPHKMDYGIQLAEMCGLPSVLIKDAKAIKQSLKGHLNSSNGRPSTSRSTLLPPPTAGNAAAGAAGTSTSGTASSAAAPAADDADGLVSAADVITTNRMRIAINLAAELQPLIDKIDSGHIDILQLAQTVQSVRDMRGHELLQAGFDGTGTVVSLDRAAAGLEGAGGLPGTAANSSRAVGRSAVADRPTTIMINDSQQLDDTEMTHYDADEQNDDGAGTRAQQRYVGRGAGAAAGLDGDRDDDGGSVAMGGHLSQVDLPDSSMSSQQSLGIAPVAPAKPHWQELMKHGRMGAGAAASTSTDALAAGSSAVAAADVDLVLAGESDSGHAVRSDAPMQSHSKKARTASAAAAVATSRGGVMITEMPPPPPRKQLQQVAANAINNRPNGTAAAAATAKKLASAIAVPPSPIELQQLQSPHMQHRMNVQRTGPGFAFTLPSPGPSLAAVADAAAIEAAAGDAPGSKVNDDDAIDASAAVLNSSNASQATSLPSAVDGADNANDAHSRDHEGQAAASDDEEDSNEWKDELRLAVALETARGPAYDAGLCIEPPVPPTSTISSLQQQPQECGTAIASNTSTDSIDLLQAAMVAKKALAALNGGQELSSPSLAELKHHKAHADMQASPLSDTAPLPTPVALATPSAPTLIDEWADALGGLF